MQFIHIINLVFNNFVFSPLCIKKREKLNLKCLKYDEKLSIFNNDKIFQIMGTSKNLV